MTDRADVLAALLRTYPRTMTERAGWKPATGRPSELFGLLVVSMLVSARISSDLALRGATALNEAGLTTPQKMRGATWKRRVTVLNRSGYARFDESTARMLGQTCDHLHEAYGDDLRQLRDAAGGESKAVHTRLQEFTGIGAVGADVFCREAQGPWPELRPFVDDSAARGAEVLGLPKSARGVAGLVDADDLPRLVNALALAGRSDDVEVLRAGQVPLRVRTLAELKEAAKVAAVSGRTRMGRDDLLRALGG